MDLAGVDSEGVPRQAAAATLTRVARFPQSPMLRVVLPVTKYFSNINESCYKQIHAVELMCFYHPILLIVRMLDVVAHE